MPQVVTANRLTDGIVVFLGPGGSWVEYLSQATVFDGKPAVEEALGTAQKAVAANLVVDVFAFDVTVGAQGPQANHIRDRIRAMGPTVHPDHGKQAVAR
jgi:sulfite reductase (NADPH) hemoprotein beta-component